MGYADSFYELSKSYEGADYPGKPASGKFNSEGQSLEGASEEDRWAILSERRLWENRQILRSHLNEMAKIMTEIACEVLSYKPMESRKRRLIAQAMREEGILVESPCYIPREDGTEAIVLTMSAAKHPGLSAEEAADMISVLLNRRLQLSVASPYLIDETPHSFVLEEEARFLALTGFARAVKEGETVSGDNYAVLELEKGRLTVMLSDGTGSGEQAGLESGYVLDLMEKFLEAGYSADAAVKMVNTALFAAGGDCNHPTLDICDLDLHRGSCELRKVGGAASFIKREKSVEQLSEGNLPLGIFQQTEPHPLRRELRDGDYVIMVTDGVIDAFGGQNYEAALCGAIAGIKEQNPGELAERLLRTALIASGGRIADDMTVCVVGVWETNGEEL